LLKDPAHSRALSFGEGLPAVTLGKPLISMQNFDGFNLHPALMRGVTDLGFTVPTPIQRSGIPPALEGRDVLGAAATGSGKTAAFALPILQRLLATPRRGVTRALVLAPTRELAEQITEQFNKLAKHTSIRAFAIYGGVGMHPQERSLRRGVEVLVACPGRLLDHMSRGGYARLGGLEVLVLDEADRMLDMGFLPDIRRILAIVPKASQTLLFSATMPREIAGLAETLQRNAVKLDIERPAAAAMVEQAIFQVRQDLKSALLLELLRGETIANALVFTRTKHRADRVAQFLERNGVACDRVHGDRTQFQRQQAVDGFRSGRTRVLVATDVAARGIDIKALSHVVNFDVPGQARRLHPPRRPHRPRRSDG
jgi:ATP-dependent RNA helicase RhlE